MLQISIFSCFVGMYVRLSVLENWQGGKDPNMGAVCIQVSPLH